MSDKSLDCNNQDDAKDAARWRAIRKFLAISWSHREWWETVSQRGDRRTEERREEWYWHLIYDESEAFDLGGTVKDRTMIPTVEAAVDAYIASEGQYED